MITLLTLTHMLFLYPLQLTPGDSEIVDKHKAALSDAKAYVRKLSVVTLGDKAAKEDKDKEEDDAKDKNEVWGRHISIFVLSGFILHIPGSFMDVVLYSIGWCQRAFQALSIINFKIIPILLTDLVRS